MNRQERGDIAERLYTEEQLTCRQIAERLGCSRSTIHRDLRDRNVKMRPGPEWYRNQRIAQQMIRRAERRRKKLERQRASLEVWNIEAELDSI